MFLFESAILFTLAGLRATTSLDSSAAKGEEPTASDAHDAREAAHPQAISSTMVFLCAFSSPRWQRWQRWRLSPTSSLQGFSALSAGKKKPLLLYLQSGRKRAAHDTPFVGKRRLSSCLELLSLVRQAVARGLLWRLSAAIATDRHQRPRCLRQRPSRRGGTSVLVPTRGTRAAGC